MASKSTQNELKGVDGPAKAAMIMMALNEDQAAKLFGMMTDDEIKENTQAMAALGSIKGSAVEALFVEFADQMASTGSLVGTFDSTERLLLKVLDSQRVTGIMEEIRGTRHRSHQSAVVRSGAGGLFEKRISANRGRRGFQGLSRKRRRRAGLPSGRVCP